MAKLPTPIRTQVKSLEVTADEIRKRAFLNAHETWAMLIERAAATIKDQAARIAELEAK